MNIHLIHHVDPESKGLLREMNRKLNHIIEGLKHMATDEQVTKLTSDVEALLKAIADKQPPAPPPAPTADPAVDELDAKVIAATEKLTAPTTT